MRRLEYARPIRALRGHARNAAEAVTVLAQVARERHRLHQERRSLEKRLRRIDARLGAITATELKLVPIIRTEGSPSPPPPVVPRAMRMAAGALTLQY